MKPFTIYKANGQIIRSGNSPEDMLEYQVNENEFLIIGDYSDTKYYIDTTSEHSAKLIPESPNTAYVFNYDSKQWEDSRSTREVKNKQWELIKRERTKVEFGTFEYNGMLFDGDLDAQRRLSTYISISKSNSNFTAMFILADNSIVQLTASDFIAIEVAKATQVAEAFEKAATLRNLIENSSSKDVIEGIVW